ncbi:SIR2 family protein [Sorangium sp. So ce131]|uniref:SIR2 family protein n=1 Tax=Sorangium sp. So ce131 TaxID=3133282 RepID=UPI003F5E3C7F
MPTLMDNANTTSAAVDAAVIEELRAAFESGELVLFVGGGISAAAGLPTWRQLVDLLVERVRDQVGDELVVAEVAELARSQRHSEALAAAEHALGPAEFNTFVEDALDDEGLEPPRIAIALAALRDRLRAVLTTNINHLLERAFGADWEPLWRITDEVAWRRRIIVKMHGTLKDPSSWVFTRERFHKAIAAPAVRSALTTVLSTCPMLFVGFGRADGNLDEMLSDIHALSGSSPPPRFVLVPRASLTPYRRTMLVDMGFQLLPYDTPDGSHDEALAILERASAARPRASSPPPAASTHARRSILPPPIPDLELPPSSSPLGFPAYDLPLDLPPGFASDLSSEPAGYDDTVTAPGALDAARRDLASEPPASPIEVFFSYSESNRELRDKLETHLAILKRKGVIRGWHDGEIGAGEERDRALAEHLETAKVILLLISADFLASDFCYDVEMQKAIERHERGEARVIPVILDACDWEGAPFGKLASLPRGGRPVTSWVNQSEAFTDIAKGIRKQVEQLTQNPP